jgi:hypothetical protein
MGRFLASMVMLSKASFFYPPLYGYDATVSDTRPARGRVGIERPGSRHHRLLAVSTQLDPRQPP